MSTRHALAIALWVVVATSSSMASINPAPTATWPSVSAPNPYEVYLRCVEAMQSNPIPKYVSYDLKVYSNHINITRAYDSAGYPTTTLHFGVGHEEDAYLVRYRASDGTSSMRDSATHDVTIGPPVPWPLDFRSFGKHAPSTGETVTAGSVTTDSASSLLDQLSVNQCPQYRVTFAPNGVTPQSYTLELTSISGDPNAHALRELVVDAASFRALAATFEVGQHHFLFGGTLRLRVAFAQVGDYWLNTDGVLTGRGHYAFVPLQGSYAYHATNFHFPARLPGRPFATTANAVSAMGTTRQPQHTMTKSP